MTKAPLLKRIDRAWDGLMESYAGLPEADLIGSVVTGSWTVRDIVAHVTWWEEEALTHLPPILEGGVPPRYSLLYGGIDAFNAMMTQRVKDLSFSDVLRRRDEVHERLIAFIRGVPDHHLESETRFRRRLRLDTYGHYPKHAAAIRKWRERRATSAH